MPPSNKYVTADRESRFYKRFGWGWMRPRKHAEIGYLNACIALQHIRLDQLKKKILELKVIKSQLDQDDIVKTTKPPILM